MNQPANKVPFATEVSRRGFLAGGATVLLTTSVARAFSGTRKPVFSAQTNGSQELKAQRLTWAGVKLELTSVTLFIDPLVSADVWGQALKTPIVPVETSTPRTHVLITHLHNDHFDFVAVRKVLGEKGNVVCTSDMAAVAASRGFRVLSDGLWEPLSLGDFIVTPVPSVDGNGDSQVAWVVAGGGKKIIHCGDTMWHGWFWKIGKQHGPFDIAFLPINGAKFGGRLPASELPAVMTPEQAVAAGIVLGAKLAVPIHYGVSGADTYEEQANAEGTFLEIAKKRKLPVEIVKPGEWVKWKASE